MIAGTFGGPGNIRQFTQDGMARAAMAGGTRSNGNAPKMASQGLYNGLANQFTDALGGAVEGYGNIAAKQLRREVGTFLGNLNSIGGLRSGSVQAGLDQLTQGYADQIGNYAMQLAPQGLQLAQNENDLQTERAFRERQYRDAQKASHRRTLGKLLGGALGGALSFVPGAGKVLEGAKTVAGIFG